MPGQLIDNVDCAGAHQCFMVIRSKLLRHPSRELTFVVLLDFESDRASRYRSLHDTAHHSDNRGGIDSAAEKGAQWNVAH